MERPPDPRCPARSNRYVEQKFEQPESTISACEVPHLRRAEAAGIGGSYGRSTAEPGRGVSPSPQALDQIRQELKLADWRSAAGRLGDRRAAHQPYARPSLVQLGLA